MAAEQRIYKVTNGANTHLVQAVSQAQALRHVAGKTFTVDVAKAIDVAQLMGKGVQLETATVVAEQSQLDIGTQE
jgi:ribosome biogenesis SPOUT family RNA methylase Rps3